MSVTVGDAGLCSCVCVATGSVDMKRQILLNLGVIVQELCESRGGRPGLSVLTSLLVSVDVKIY